jgi:hypothetical protein
MFGGGDVEVAIVPIYLLPSHSPTAWRRTNRPWVARGSPARDPKRRQCHVPSRCTVQFDVFSRPYDTGLVLQENGAILATLDIYKVGTHDKHNE